jgi:hypothetical protein
LCACLRKNPTSHQPPGAGMHLPGRRYGRAEARPYGENLPTITRLVPRCAHPAGVGDAQKRVPTGKIYRPPPAGCRDARTRQAVGTRRSASLPEIHRPPAARCRDAPTRQALGTRRSASLRGKSTGHHPPGVEMRAPGRRWGHAEARPYGKTPPATSRRVPGCAHPAGGGDAQKRVPTGKIATGHQPPGAGMHLPGRRYGRAQARPYGENRHPHSALSTQHSALSTQHSALSTTKELTTCQPVLC